VSEFIAATFQHGDKHSGQVTVMHNENTKPATLCITSVQSRTVKSGHGDFLVPLWRSQKNFLTSFFVGVKLTVYSSHSSHLYTTMIPYKAAIAD